MEEKPVIRVMHTPGDYRAELENNPKVWSPGKTPELAVENLKKENRHLPSDIPIKHDRKP